MRATLLRVESVHSDFAPARRESLLEGQVLCGRMLVPFTKIWTPRNVRPLHRNEADFEKDKESGWAQGTEIAVDQLVNHVLSMTSESAVLSK